MLVPSERSEAHIRHYRACRHSRVDAVQILSMRS
jgi:hypothetical protein